MTAFARTAAQALSIPIAGAAPIVTTAAIGAAEAAMAVEMAILRISVEWPMSASSTKVLDGTFDYM